MLMEWAILLLLLVIVGVHWFDYSRTIKEYTFAQMAPGADLGTVLSEKTPIMIEINALPWRPEIAQKSHITVTTEAGEVLLRDWMSHENKGEIDANKAAEDIGLSTGLTDITDAKALWWLPGLYNITVDVLEQGEIQGLSWVAAERQWIGCSSGGPLLLWLVHSRYRRFLPEDTVDPWNLTVETAPYIGRVQYIEVRVQPGWAIGLPAHWGWAIRNEGEPAWSWNAEQHSALSLMVSQTPAATAKLYNTVQEMIDHDNVQETV